MTCGGWREQLGAALFIRSTRRVELTPAGARLLSGARRLWLTDIGL
ncbi:LysR family transcriptional regulator [Nonomuraea polychroma]